MTEKMIEKLEAKGFKRWTKGSMDRLYINAEDLGLDCGYYNSGNISSATFKGERISNSEAYRLGAAKTYIDVATGKLVGTKETLTAAAQEIIDEVTAEIEAEEKAAEEETEEKEMSEKSEKNEAAEQIAKEIRESDMWDGDACRELCRMAGMEQEWTDADGETFEQVVYAAADKLGVEI